MNVDRNKVVTQEDLKERAPIDQVEDRVEAEMKKLEGQAKEQVAAGLNDEKLAREGKRLRKEGEQKLREEREST